MFFMMSNLAWSACGSISMADMNWPSATLMANVDKIILEEGYGCEIEMVAGATTTTFASMNEKGQPDVAAELWLSWRWVTTAFIISNYPTRTWDARNRN